MTRRITVDVYEKNNTTHVGTLDSDEGREWLEDLGGEGTGTIESQLDHADRAMLTHGRVLRFSIDGTPRWAGCEFELNPVIADPNNRQAGRVIGLVCHDLLAIFDYAIVLPELGFGRISPDTRYLGWMSRYYDHSGWGNAVELKVQNDPDPTKPWFGAPRGFPDPNAKWIGPAGGDTPPVDPGDIYFWGDYTIPVGEGGDYRASQSADDGFQFFRDGDLEAAEARVALWGLTRPVDFQADEGAHFFGVKLTNFDRPNPATNVTGYICSLAPILGGGVRVGSPVSGTSSGTKMLAYPASEPGLTAGRMIWVLVLENQTLGWHTDLTRSFSDTHDTNGVPWPKELNLVLQVEMSLTDVMRKMRDMKAAEFAMDPVGKVLHAYVSKGADLTIGGSPVAVAYADNVNRLGMRQVGPGGNTTVSKTAEGRFVLSEDAVAVAAWGRRLVGLSLGTAASDGSAEDQTAAFFEDHANPTDAITNLQVEDDRFFDGTVQTGDLVTGPTPDGATTTYRVHGLRFADDDSGSGTPVCTPELVAT
jgi:hypothetical protein